MQTLLVFQQNGSGKHKIEGIRRFCGPGIELNIVNIDSELPPILDDTSAYLPETIEADLVLDYLVHRDLSEDLSIMCDKLKIPVIAPGRKIISGSALCPPICCALADHEGLGEYGRRFGTPRMDVDVEAGRIKEIRVSRGAPCGATWLAADKVRDLPLEEALTRFGLEVQFFCSANPAGWDPLWGKSPVHLAADIHSGVLKGCLKKSKSRV
ncbi:DUF166 family (seleno)protein DfsP [Desulfospira joergensenii]|uniref:DUF166 family (seleno)protein DfsP n=1 Tax=Desulfospira joergensenii TaxID=53329 RepID=UPI00047FD756|nr:DUF166 family (seleno)protein DfsP [Desulfospira joergensenii]